MDNQNQQTFYTSTFEYTGGLNSDDFYGKVSKGDVLPQDGIGNLNISVINTNGSNDGSIFGINGNAFSLNLPIISTQNKIYQFVIQEPATGTNYYNFNFSNLNYSVIGNVYLATTGDIVADQSTLETIIESFTGSYGLNISTVITVGNTLTVTIFFTALIGFDWLIQDIPTLVITDSGNSFTGFSVGDTIYDQTNSLLLGTIKSISTGVLVLSNAVSANISSGTDVLVNQSGTTVALTAGTGTFSTSVDALITQEAIDRSLTDFDAGYCLPIGGIDYLGDLFVMSTCQGNYPKTLNLVGCSRNEFNKIAINVLGNQLSLFPVGESIVVNGVTASGDITNANGTWLVETVIYNGTTTTMTLYSAISTSGTYTGGGTVTLYSEGFLNVSVHQKNQTYNTWTNYSLLSTKSVNSRFYNPIRKEINANKNNNTLNIYFTDGVQFPRIFSYIGEYITNGAISFYNPLALYDYDDVEPLMRTIKTFPTLRTQVSQVLDSGGNTLAGNWRFATQGLDSNLTAAGVSILSNPVNLYAQGSFSTPNDILGSDTGVGNVTPMQVIISVTDILEGVYSYINLIGINYTGSTEVTYLIKQVPIASTATSIDITYTGLETLTPYSGGFTLSSLAINSWGTQTICSNTLVAADITYAQINDFSTFFQQWTHILQTGKSPDIYLAPTGDDVTGYTFGEYQNPIKTAECVGYMLNETYRYWGVVELKNGGFTPCFWIDDIRFDLGVTNIANPFNQVNRRVGNNITSYDLSQSPGTVLPADINSYVFYVTLLPPTGYLNYLIDGVPLNELIERIHIFRTDNTVMGLNEVISCGLGIRHVNGTATNDTLNLKGYLGDGTHSYLYDNPFRIVKPLVFGITTDPNLPTINLGANTNLYSSLFGSPTFQYSAWTTYQNQITPPATISKPGWAQSFSFYSPDVMYGQVSLPEAGSSIYIFSHGQPNWELGSGLMDLTALQTIPTATPTFYSGSEIRLSGSTGGLTADDYANKNPILFSKPIADFGGVIGGLPNSLFYCSGWETSYGAVWDTPQHQVIYCSNDINQPNSSVNNADMGMYYIEYYRDLGSVIAYSTGQSKFGAINTGTGIPTGAVIDISSNIGQVDVFGGDTFTQKAFLKIQYGSTAGNGTTAQGGGVTCVIICQNRMNFNMRNPGNLAYPSTPPIDGWINDYNGGGFVEIDNYDAGYTPRNPDDTLNAYSSTVPYVTVAPERIIYSLQQPQNSVSNNYQQLPALNFYDLSSDKGIITNVFSLQNELFSLQEKTLLRQFFNELGTLNVGENTTPTQVSLGSGSPFTKPPVPLLPNIGNSNNLSLLYGIDLNGKDILAWIDVITRSVIILKASGETETISLTKKMRTWFDQWLTVTYGDTPPLNYIPITGVFDLKRYQFVWTLCGISSSAQAWVNSTPYNQGQLVTQGVSGMEGVLQVYQSLVNNNIMKTPANNPTYWEAVSTSESILITGANFSTFSNGDLILDTTATPPNNIYDLAVYDSGIGFNKFMIGDTLVGGGSFDLSFDNSFKNGSVFLGTVIKVSPSNILISQIGNTNNFSAGDTLMNQNGVYVTTDNNAVSAVGRILGTTIQTTSTSLLISSDDTVVPFTSGDMLVNQNIVSVSTPSTVVTDVYEPNNLAYNYYTIVYSLITGRFMSFQSVRPYFYVAFENTYLTASPNYSYNNSLWEDDLSSPLFWYGGLLEKNAHLTYPVNDFPEVSKRWIGQYHYSSIIPYYLLFTTKECSSYLLQSDEDWDNLNSDAYYNSIQLDTVSSPTGSPQGDTSPVYGSYLIVNETLSIPSDGIYQYIYKIISKFVPLSRLPTT